MSIPINLEEAWKTSRAGARAGSGFRFQDAATVLTLLRCWSGEINANAATPESLDDFSLEASNSITWVQVKSKIDPKSRFRVKEIADIIMSDILTIEDQRAIILDRPFLDYENLDWNRKISEDSKITAALLEQLKDDQPALDKLRTRLNKIVIITSTSPINKAIEIISHKYKIGESLASICASHLLHLVGSYSSENARHDYKSRKSVTIGDIERIFSNVLNLVDPDVVDRAFQLGITHFISFHEPVEDIHFYEGVATKPGHVSAGLVQPREEDVDFIVDQLFSGRHVLVAGPSGSGKSALSYLTAFETRHAFRWIELTTITDMDHSTLLRSLQAQQPTEERPIIVYIDDVGRGTGITWRWLIEQSRHMPGIRLVGSVREEDVGILSTLDQVTIIRPKLSEMLAQQIWERLYGTGTTKIAYWKEAYELSNGLLLEFTHILTKGNRLRVVIEEQIRQRIQEARNDELMILPIAAAAGMYGTCVSKELLIKNINLNQALFSSAFLRLRNEHLIGIEQEGQISGLHELRSREIFKACCKLLVLTPHDTVINTFHCVPSIDTRRYLTRSAREGLLNIKELLSIGITRLNTQPDILLLAGILEALRLVSLDSDAETFKRIADKYNLSHSEYIVAILFLNPSTFETLSDPAPLFSHLKSMMKEFISERVPDLREELLDLITPNTMKEVAKELDTPKVVCIIFTALHGIPLNSLHIIIDQALKIMPSAAIEDIVEFLSILEESNSPFFKKAVNSLGGSEYLLERLWKETPWSVKPELNIFKDGSVNITADLLAVTGELLTAPDKIVFDYASKAILLCPSAKSITSQPLNISGHVYEVNGYAPGVKKLSRHASHSKASITWNRMFIHAIAQKHIDSSRTEVLERHKYGLTQAASQFFRAVDYFCRGKHIKRKYIHEAKALELIVEIMPPLPLGRPEDVLDNPLVNELDDEVGRLIDQVARAIQKISAGNISGIQLTMDMETITKSVINVSAYDGWSYIGEPPTKELREIEYISNSLRRIGLAIGQKKIAHTSPILPSKRLWGQGKGLTRALQNLDRLWNSQWNKNKYKIEKQFNVSTFAVLARKNYGYTWPDYEICLLVKCDSFVDFFTWLDDNLVKLRSFFKSHLPLTIVPQLVNSVIPQMAMQILSFAVIPDQEFESKWHDSLGDLNWHVSDTINQLHIFQESLINLHAAQHHLKGRELLKEEIEQLQIWKKNAEDAFSSISNAANTESTEGAIVAKEFLEDFYNMIVNDDDPNYRAVTIAHAQLNAIMSESADEHILEVASIIVTILEIELGVLSID